jgi:hypothetical protein
MNCLDQKTRAQVIRCLIEGCSIRATVRLTGAAKNTVVKLLEDLGTACAIFHDLHVRNLKVRRMQADEIWCFVGCKKKNATPTQKAEGWGDVWTWVGMDADTKLVIGLKALSEQTSNTPCSTKYTALPQTMSSVGIPRPSASAPT